MAVEPTPDLFARAWLWAIVISASAGITCGFALALRSYGEEKADDAFVLVEIDPGVTMTIFVVGGAVFGLAAGGILGAMVTAAIVPELRNRIARATSTEDAARSVGRVLWAVLGMFTGIAIVLTIALGQDATESGRLTAAFAILGAVAGAALALVLLQAAAKPFAVETPTSPPVRRSRPLRAPT